MKAGKVVYRLDAHGSGGCKYMTDSIERLVLGDTEAWSEFTERYAPVIYSAVEKTLRVYSGVEHIDSAGDIVQEVFVRLIKNDYRTLRSYNPSKSAPATFLSIVSRSAAIDFLRALKPEVPGAEELIQDMPAPEKPQAPDLEIPEELLSPRQKLVLHLLFDKELTVSEAAQTLGVEEQTIRSAKHKALTRLRNYFKPPAEEGYAGDLTRITGEAG